MSTTNLRRWLRRQPHPARLRVDGRDVAVATGARMWVVTEETILSLNPSRVEALDANGMCLRAIVLGDEDDDDGKSAQKQHAAELVSADARLVEIARLISEAYTAGAAAHAQAYELAFRENTNLVQVLAQRLGGLEAAWQKAMQQSAKDNANALALAAEAAAAEGGDPAGAMIATMMQMAAQHAQANGAKPNGAPKPPAPPNGKGK